MSASAKNVNYCINENLNTLTITVDLSEDLGISGTGKSNTVASTYGWEPLEDGETIFNLNVNRRLNGG